MHRAAHGLCCCPFASPLFTQQLGLRTLSVGLANNLLMNLPEPFKHSTFAAAAAATAPGAPPPSQPQGVEADAAFVATPAPTRAVQGGSSSSRGAGVPAGMVVAPWSVVALATLLHRYVLLSGHIYNQLVLGETRVHA
jgi:hypothetical protein